MTVKEVYNYVLVELNKVQAPSILLDDFVYLLNKSIQRYVNKRYNLFEVNQQLTDDLRVLTMEADLVLEDAKTPYIYKLPTDYMHILNCICEFTTSNMPCGEGSNEVGASKLDTAQLPHVIQNFYMKPSRNRPYYYICYKTDPNSTPITTSSTPGYYDPSKGYPKTEGDRYGNAQIPIIQIKCGNTPLNNVKITYLRAPKYVDLTFDELDQTVDITPHLEFPDYVTYEIINEMVTLILENHKDPRLQTQLGLSQTIVNPGMATQKS